MPVIYDPPPPLTHQYAPSPVRDYAIATERFHHTEALYRFGEHAMFALMWTERDFEQGRVGRCSRCFASTGNNAAIASVYKQANLAACPVCLGTSFEGGYRALVVRPSLWVFSEDADTEGRRGITIGATAEVQTTYDFQMHTGDFVLRGDGTRWQVGPITAPHLSEGFETPTNVDNLVANSVRVNKEDPSSSAYQVGPGTSELISILNQYNTNWPTDFTAIDEVRSPLDAPYDR